MQKLPIGIQTFSEIRQGHYTIAMVQWWIKINTIDYQKSLLSILESVGWVKPTL